MNKDIYTPRNNGIAGLEEFGGIEHADDYTPAEPVYINGKRVVGPTYEPALVYEFFAKGGRITHGGTVWAHGALRFSPGWDAKASTASAQTSVYVDTSGDHHEHVGYCGRDYGSVSDE